MYVPICIRYVQGFQGLQGLNLISLGEIVLVEFYVCDYRPGRPIIPIQVSPDPATGKRKIQISSQTVRTKIYDYILFICHVATGPDLKIISEENVFILAFWDRALKVF